MYDLIILGGGPAGLTATVYALRKRLNVLMITRDLGGKTNYRLQLPFVEKHLVITGEEVVSRFANEVDYLEFSRVFEKAEQVKKIKGGFEVKTREEKTYKAKSIIVATGAWGRRLEVPGEKEFMMRGLCYSAVSYAPLFIDRDVVVIGDTALALRSTAELARIAKQVTLVAPSHGELDSDMGKKVLSAENVNVLEASRLRRCWVMSTPAAWLSKRTAMRKNSKPMLSSSNLTWIPRPIWSRTWSSWTDWAISRSMPATAPRPKGSLLLATSPMSFPNRS